MEKNTDNTTFQGNNTPTYSNSETNTNPREDFKLKPHDLISTKILNGNFKDDPYTYINEKVNANEEYLVFISHGVGQNSDKLNRILNTKIKPNIENLYKHKDKYLKKQIHVRIIDWKTTITHKTGDKMKLLLDQNNETRYPKLFIQQAPLDILRYLSENNKYDIMNDVIHQMNTYYECVRKHRPLFKGGVSVVGHSLGSVIFYDIFTNMTMEEIKHDMANNTSNLNVSLSPRKRFSTMEIEIKREASEFKLENENAIYQINRNQRKDRVNNIADEVSKFSIDIDTMKIDTKIDEIKEVEETINDFYDMNEEESSFPKKKIYSKIKEIQPLLFPLDHFFLLGSPLALFLTANNQSGLEEMEIVKDFHNIIHPMDPIAYRIEPLIEHFPESANSFTLPHWQNDGLRNLFLDQFLKLLCFQSRKKEEYINHDDRLGRKRYDFIVQENGSEKTINLIGFLFSHQAYWNNPDVFYFIMKMIHWQGYTSADQKRVHNYHSNNGKR